MPRKSNDPLDLYLRAVEQVIGECDRVISQFSHNHTFVWVDVSSGERVTVPSRPRPILSGRPRPGAMKRNQMFNRALLAIQRRLSGVSKQVTPAILHLPLDRPVAADFSHAKRTLEEALDTLFRSARRADGPEVDWPAVSKSLDSAMACRDRFREVVATLRSTPTPNTVRVGWTKMEMCERGRISGSTFKHILDSTKIEGPRHGQRGFRFKVAHVHVLIQACASHSEKPAWKRAGERWRSMVDQTKQNT
jgi:hypothetical protein